MAIPRTPGVEAAGLACAASRIAADLATWVAPQPAARVSGGCISTAYRWESGAGPLFVKLAGSPAQSMFASEAAGLHELAAAGAIRTPRVLAAGVAGRHAFLVLEWIELRALTAASRRRLGQCLAQQHRRRASRFGWHHDNTIGSTTQMNAWSTSWPEFFRDRRLRFQLDLAGHNGYGGPLRDRGAQLLERMHVLLRDHAPQASLLHGDMWSGNAASDAAGLPVVFDPAVYYGDREVDLAMTRLFGGFGRDFHAGYETAWPLPPGASDRVDLYNLYHVLNHLNLFGAVYLAQATRLIDTLLARAGS